jgi:hypothetical protein
MLSVFHYHFKVNLVSLGPQYIYFFFFGNSNPDYFMRQ